MSCDTPEDSSGGCVVGYDLRSRSTRFAHCRPPATAIPFGHRLRPEPARVPPGLAGQAVRRLISSSVSVSVASLLVVAFRLGVLMYTP